MDEKLYIRDLAKKQAETASSPIMQTRKKLWTDHYDFKNNTQPMIIFEFDTILDNIFTPELKCKEPVLRDIEYRLLKNEFLCNEIGDDRVMDDHWTVNINAWMNLLNTPVSATHAINLNGNNLGFEYNFPLKDASEYHKLGKTTFHHNFEEAQKQFDFMQNLFGDILPVRYSNGAVKWLGCMTQRLVEFMGLENMMISMYDFPDETHKIMRMISESHIEFVKFMEENNLLTLNNGNDFLGGGHYGFTSELPENKGKNGDDKIFATDIWGYSNSQESSGISPDMYGEFVFPYIQEFSELFGLNYYGCCEAVDAIYDKYVRKIRNLRGISVSPWCNEEKIGDMLKNSKTIYSRKIQPTILGGNDPFLDQKVLFEHIKTTVLASKTCKLEFIFRDHYTIHNDMEKLRTAMNITRNVIEKYKV